MTSFPDPGARRRAVEEVGSFASALGVREIVREDANANPDLLKRIDPDGALHRVVYMAWAETKAGGDFSADILLALHEHGALRLPDEPTLAEVREKVVSLKYAHELTGAYRVKSVSAYLDDVLALLEPRKKLEPPKTVAEVRAMVQHLHDTAENDVQRCAYGVVLAHLGDT